jgi:triacylglycerol esterase/lipase EstA (alpha/beta hydrolase family)
MAVGVPTAFAGEAPAPASGVDTSASGMDTVAPGVGASASGMDTVTSGVDTGGYSALDRPGPALSVPVQRLRAAVSCTANVAGAGRDPVLLVAGTGHNPTSNFAWNYQRAFSRAGRPWCSVTVPGNSMGDIQVAAEYVVYALRHVGTLSGRKVDVLGWSQGGMSPRWALRFWPDTRALVDDLVGLAPSNHGTVDAQVCAVVCPDAFWQQRASSRFTAALNSGVETFAGIAYTVVYTRLDEVVMPNLDARTGSSSLRTGGGHISNLAVQDVCPLSVADHLALGSYDAVGYAAAIDAFDHAGPASSARIPRSVCAKPFHEGVSPLTFALDLAGFTTATAANIAAYPMSAAEPALKPYVLAR